MEVTVSPASRLVHCAVGTPARFTVPVIVESGSQNKSTTFPVTRVRAVPALTSILDRFAATRPPWLLVIVAPITVACELLRAITPCPLLLVITRYPFEVVRDASSEISTPPEVPP
jgi:hypothetical protein